LRTVLCKAQIQKVQINVFACNKIVSAYQRQTRIGNEIERKISAHIFMNYRQKREESASPPLFFYGRLHFSNPVGQQQSETDHRHDAAV